MAAAVTHRSGAASGEVPAERVDTETSGAGIYPDLDADVVDLGDVLGGEDVHGCARRVHAAGAHEDQRVRDAGRLVEVVQHDADRDAVLLDEVAHGSSVSIW